MAAKTENIPLIVALVNSVTLEAEILFSSHFGLHEPKNAPLNIYAVAQLMDKSRRMLFAQALKHGRSFECLTACEGHRLSICLYIADNYGSDWSHVLVLRDLHSDVQHA